MQSASSPELVRLELSGLTREGVPVLGPLSLVVTRGETLAVLGPSGIGKTTLLRVIAGLQTGFEGTLEVTPSLAYVFQEPTLLPWRSVLKNITLPTGCSPGLAAERLAEVGLADKADLFPGQLSLGQQRRLSLARALASEAELLLMDEPFVSLDADLAEEMQDLFLRLREAHRLTTIFVTHAQDEAQRLSTRVVTLGGSPAVIAAEATH